MTDTRCIKLYAEPREAENAQVSSHYAHEPNVLTVRHQSLYPFYSVTAQAPTSRPLQLACSLCGVTFLKGVSHFAVYKPNKPKGGNVRDCLKWRL